MHDLPTAHTPSAPAGSPARDDLQRTLEQALGTPFLPGNRVEWLLNGHEIFPAMLSAIGSARDSVDFVTFVYWRGEIARRFADALAERAASNVRVRVLLDALGAKRMDRRIVSRMEDAGAEVRWFRPLRRVPLHRMDQRTHRKILVCDGRVGFTGGVGIAEQWEGDARDATEWRDTHARLTGPCIGPLKAAFLDNWNEALPARFDSRGLDARLERTGDVPVQVIRSNVRPGWTDMATLLRTLVAASRKELLLTSAYFFPDPLLVDMLAEAASERGVRVRVMFADRHADSRLPLLAGRRDWGRLMDAGVELWRYQRTMLHTKQYTVDGSATCLGSPNLNHRSLGKDAECCFVVLSPRLAAEARGQFARDLEACERVDPAAWRGRGRLKRVQESLARTIAGQL